MGLVRREGQPRHGVHVVDPRALLVAADGHVVPRQQQLRRAVAQGRQRGEARVLIITIIIIITTTAAAATTTTATAANFPDSNFVILVRAEELVARHDKRLHRTVPSS